MKVITIGRESDNDVVINDSLVGRYHCQIVQHDDGRFSIVDLKSKNGVFVNKYQITGEVFLNLNDKVNIGKAILPWKSYFPPNPIPSPTPPTPPTPPPPPPVIVERGPVIPPDININKRVESIHADVYKRGDDFKVPFFRKSGELIGSTAGCIGSVVMIIIVMVIFGLLLKACS